MENHSLLSLVIVIVSALLTPIVLHRIKLNMFIPVVVAEIIVGFILGKSGLDFVQPDALLEMLSALGFIFLMFLSGLEVDFQLFKVKPKNGKGKAKKPNTLLVASLVFIMIFIFSIGLSYLFVLLGFVNSVFLMTIIISTISLGVVVPTLKEENLMKSTYGQIILIVAVIADLVTMILLAVFVSINDEGGGNTWLLLLLFAAGVLFYFIGRRFKNGKLIKSLSKGTTQIGTRAVFALIIFLVAISETVGAESILGAFLAGVLVSLLSPSKELVNKLDSFGYGFLIPIFFVMIGVELNIWALFSDPKLLLLIPLLLIALFLSKIIPIWILRKWYSLKAVVAAGSILTSTLSLSIAAATIGESMGLISNELSGTFILVAILSCIITPAIFKKLLPKHETGETHITVAIIGANQLTLPVYYQLKTKTTIYKPTIFHRKQEKINKLKTNGSAFQIIELTDYDEENFKKHDVFAYNIVVLATGDEHMNARLALLMEKYEVERIITRVENNELARELIERGIERFSSLQAQNILLRTIIESPSMVQLLMNQETSIFEVQLLNNKYHGLRIRKIPFLGDVLFIQILRGRDVIIPNGDTVLERYDRIMVSGSQEYIEELRQEFELT